MRSGFIWCTLGARFLVKIALNSRNSRTTSTSSILTRELSRTRTFFLFVVLLVVVVEVVVGVVVVVVVGIVIRNRRLRRCRPGQRLLVVSHDTLSRTRRYYSLTQ